MSDVPRQEREALYDDSEQQRTTDYLKNCAASETEVRQMLWQSFESAAIQALLQDLLLRNPKQETEIREALIKSWKESVVKQHLEGFARLEKLMRHADPSDPMLATMPTPQEQADSIMGMIQEVETEIRSILISGER